MSALEAQTVLWRSTEISGFLFGWWLSAYHIEMHFVSGWFTSVGVCVKKLELRGCHSNFLSTDTFFGCCVLLLCHVVDWLVSDCCCEVNNCRSHQVQKTKAAWKKIYLKVSDDFYTRRSQKIVYNFLKMYPSNTILNTNLPLKAFFYLLNKLLLWVNNHCTGTAKTLHKTLQPFKMKPQNKIWLLTCIVTTPNHNQDITGIYLNIIHLILYPLHHTSHNS